MEYLEATVDKFVFRSAPDRRYTATDVWAKREGRRIRVGITDYLQQKSGDAAFANVRPAGTALSANDELATVETVKVDLVIPAPVAGTIVAVNEDLAAHPEAVNADPYGDGWLAEIEPTDMADYDALIDAQTYLRQVQARAEQERGQ